MCQALCGRDARAPSKPSSHDIVTPSAQYCRSIWVPLVVEAGRSVFWSIRVDSCPFVVRFHEQSTVFAGMIQLSCGAVGRDSGTFMRRERGLECQPRPSGLSGCGRRSCAFGKVVLTIRTAGFARGHDRCRRSRGRRGAYRGELPGRLPAQAAGKPGFEIPTLAGSMDACHSGTTPTCPASLPEMQKCSRTSGL